MGKKRKHSSRAQGTTETKSKPESSKLRIDTYEDVADSEDEFLLNREKVLLEEDAISKKRRKIEEEDRLLEASDDEVLEYPSSDDEDEEEGEGDFQDGAASDEEFGEAEVNGKAQKRRKGGDEVGEDDEDEDIAGWGDEKQDYYGADEIDTEQAALDEEAEAKRLQQKQLAVISDGDPYFDMANLEEEEGESEKEDDEIVTELLPEVELPDDLSAPERLKLLHQRYPELSSIAKDFLRLQAVVSQAKGDADRAQEIIRLRRKLALSEDTESHRAILLHQALCAYLGACAMYFAVLTSTAKAGSLALAPKKLREHAVIQNLLETKQLYYEQAADGDSLSAEMEAEIAELENQSAQVEEAARQTELIPQTISIPGEAKEKKPKKSKAERQTEAQQAASETRRKERMQKMESELAALSALASTKPKKHSSKIKTNSAGKLIINESDSDLGDEAELTAADLAAKAQRKKSLKFYTSQIAQKTLKHDAKSRAAGGDEDIPYRERLKDREARLNTAAERRGKQAVKAGEALDDLSDDEGATNGVRALPANDNEGPGDEEYYDLVAARSKQRKAGKTAAAKAYAEAARQHASVREVEEVGADGKRKISYQIEKNKGLTPFRKKEVRNPRVKKKLRYADKMKKLGSVRQLYKGGEGKGGYAGELSGIKRNLVKSVKL